MYSLITSMKDIFAVKVNCNVYRKVLKTRLHGHSYLALAIAL